jgi:general secretion pathway protein K
MIERTRNHRGHTRPASFPNQAGIALIIVLWMLALLTVIANNLVFSLRTEVQSTANSVASIRAEAAADAGVFKAIQELTRPETDLQRWQGNGLVHEWAFDNIAMQITILDEAARIDLNSAPDILLSSMFRSLGLDDTTASSLADAVVDWRDPDDLRKINGAEREDYIAAGKDYVPRNANFESVEELRLVLGMNDTIFWRTLPLVTVHSGRTGVSSLVAPRAVLLALPGATPDQVESFVAQRESLLWQGLPITEASFAATSNASPLRDTFSIQVRAVLGENTVFSREAVVRTTGNLKEPVVFLAWRSPKSDIRDPAPYTANQ